jgi:hypothetical protein
MARNTRKIPQAYNTWKIQNAVRGFTDWQKARVIAALEMGYAHGCQVIDEIRLQNMQANQER